MDTADCIFCKIVRGEIPAQMFDQTDAAIVVPDIEPAAPVHYLVIPKRHVATLSEFAERESPAQLGSVLALAARTGHKASPSGYRVVVNEGPDAGQLVFHLHVHVLAGRALGWPPG
jgi:histidine triad (HIT) family protein